MVVAGVLSVTPDRPELLEWDRPEFSEPAGALLVIGCEFQHWFGFSPVRPKEYAQMWLQHT
jgi:hypothetical protein